MTPPDLARLPPGTILAVPGYTGAVRFYVRGCRCAPGPAGGAPAPLNGHGGTAEAEACAARVLAGEVGA